MLEVNYPIRKAVFSALSGITYNAVSVPVYYPYAPENAPANYITFQPVSTSEDSTMNSIDTVTSFRVTIHSKNDNDNSGRAADTIAGSVLAALHPTPRFVLDLSSDNLKMNSIRVSSDNTENYSILGQKMFIDRTIIFRMVVCHGVV